MKRVVMGYIFNEKEKRLEEKKFFRIAKKLNIEIVFFNVEEELNEKEIEEKAKKCQIIFNDSGEYITNEIVKNLESLGKKVIEDSKTAYYPEDKWFFYLECKKNNIPCPETILLPTNIENAKKELEHFNQWPLVLKKIYGSRGEFVERAKNIKEAVGIIKKFWKNENERTPIIAQEYINSDSYRVTLIGGKIVQAALKKRSGWKASGCSSMKIRKFKLDKEIERIAKKVAKITKINICGVDFAKQNGRWIVIEVNAEPSLKFFDCERDMMIEEVLRFLKSQV